MKRIFSIVIACVTMSFISSCSTTFLQVYDVASDLEKTENSLIFSNVDCSLYYNLWGEEGDLQFLFENKTNQDIFICMPLSFVIKNNVAYDYYEEGSHTNSTSRSSSTSSSTSVKLNGYFSNNFKWYPATVTSTKSASTMITSTKTKTSVNPSVVCIPANSMKFIPSYTISDYVYRDCDDRKFSYPRSVSRTIEYNKSDSPLVFRNRIAYSFDSNCSDVHYIENNFYISSVTNYIRKKAITKAYIKKSDCTTVYGEKHKYSAPHRFYNVYTGKSSAVGGSPIEYSR